MRISMGSDHAGYELKEKLKKMLENEGYEILDRGCYGEESVDYPDYAKLVSEDILNGLADRGILICGTGIGMSMSANKYKKIRAALCLYPKMAELARKHNDANILVLGGRLISPAMAKWITDTFLKTRFEGGRHAKRVRKMESLGG
ncbi:MAG: ribose 5-phosphate isomerase B [Thermotoga sp.]|nr:MAG: ribose 5-phosphate isomerase B [Thermotoga sp.]